MNSRRLKLAAAGALAVGSATSNASIVVFDFPDFTFNPNTSPYSRDTFWNINLSNGTFTKGGNVTNSSGFQFTTTYWMDIGFYGYGGYVTRSTVSPGIQFLAAGDLISGASSWDYDLAGLEVPNGLFYVGLQLQQDSSTYFGWFEFSADRTTTGAGVTPITYQRFAFNTVSMDSILAGQTTAVPEASTLGFAGGLFGLVVAAHLRRRKAKQAAASDKFLALAAGESVRG